MPSQENQISEDFFRGRVARELLGKKLVSRSGEKVAGKIVETEAYLGREDPASHLVSPGEKRREVFEKGAGTVYVFKIFHHCNLNLITEFEGVTEGVLVRAVEPSGNLDRMKERRGVDQETEIASGPGKLAEAFSIDMEMNGESLEDSPLEVRETGRDPDVKSTGRIGISEAEDWPLRFRVKDSDHASRDPDQDTIEGFEPARFY